MDFLIGKIESIITPSNPVNNSKMVYGAPWKAPASPKPCSWKSELLCSPSLHLLPRRALHCTSVITLTVLQSRRKHG